jgi:zinc and cadmium transporter
MTTLSWIVVASLLGGVLSIVAAAALALSARASWIPMLVSYAVGALLGAAFLEMLPHAFELSKDGKSATATVMIGILFFFILEKLVLWRHYHGNGGAEPVAHDHGRSGMMILVGDTIHNFVDGVLIAAAFLAGFRLGAVSAFAIIVHEIPQEVGDFVILLHSGYSRARAFMLNLVSSLATVLGGVLAYFALGAMQQWVPVLLSFAAASMIYVAVADLIPGLHKRAELRATAQQVVLIALGVMSIMVGHWLFDDHG